MRELPRLYVLMGPVYSGKTTLAKHIESATGITHVFDDGIAEEWGISVPSIRPQQSKAANEEKNRRLRAALQGGRSVIDDSLHLSRGVRDRARAVAAEARAATLLIHVDTPEEVIWQRWRANHHHQTRIQISEKRVREVLEKFEPPAHDEPHIVFRSGVDNIPTWMNEKGILLDRIN